MSLKHFPWSKPNLVRVCKDLPCVGQAVRGEFQEKQGGAVSTVIPVRIFGSLACCRKYSLLSVAEV